MEAAYDIRRPTRRCAASDRALEPGEHFYSVVVPDQGTFQRLDYSAAMWKGPPDNAIGWWKSKVPLQNPNQVYWAPNETLLACFDHVLTNRDQSTAYVLALLLVRKRILQWIETTTDPSGCQIMHLRRGRSDREFELPVCDLSEDEIHSIQQFLAEHLFMEHAPDDSLGDADA